MKPLFIKDYHYALPDERIAKHPVQPRDHSKLLLYKNGQVSEDLFYNLGHYLPSGTLLVYNNTKVIPARLVFHKVSGARIEVFLLQPLEPQDYQLCLQSQSGCVWKCMVGNLKKWKDEPLEMSISLGSHPCTLKATRLQTTGNTHSIRFEWDDATLSFAELIAQQGELPIPPYLNRPTEQSDWHDYQTVYSRIQGSVAAPTAGLHFTDTVLQGLTQQGVQIAELTLHVGAGTFQPVKTEDANLHPMHTEIIAVPQETIRTLIEKEGHICAVGTTSMRTLESLYYIGVRLAKMSTEAWQNCFLHIDQFEPYNTLYTLSLKESLEAILRYLDFTGQTVLHAETQIMIEPGFRFRVVDELITNFHQPSSTLLLLVSAFVGGDWKTIYDYALSHDFRFLSYGDSSLLWRSPMPDAHD